MKIVSEYKELEGQTFDTIEECAKAEAVVDERKVATQKLLDSKKKRALSKVIEDADQQVLAAYANYEKVKKEVQRILEESHAAVIQQIGLFFPVLRVEQACFSSLSTCGDFCFILVYSYAFVSTIKI